MVSCDHLSKAMGCSIRFAIHLGGRLVRCEWLGQDVQFAVATTDCATVMQRCDCFGERRSARIRHTFPIEFREPRSVG